MNSNATSQSLSQQEQEIESILNWTPEDAVDRPSAASPNSPGAAAADPQDPYADLTAEERAVLALNQHPNLDDFAGALDENLYDATPPPEQEQEEDVSQQDGGLDSLFGEPSVRADSPAPGMSDSSLREQDPATTETQPNLFLEGDNGDQGNGYAPAAGGRDLDLIGLFGDDIAQAAAAAQQRLGDALQQQTITPGSQGYNAKPPSQSIPASGTAQSSPLTVDYSELMRQAANNPMNSWGPFGTQQPDMRFTQRQPSQQTADLESGQQVYGTGAQFGGFTDPFMLGDVQPAADKDEVVAPAAAPEPPRGNNAVPRGRLPSIPALPLAQPANLDEMTESERCMKAAAQGKVVPPLRRVALTPETRGKTGPRPKSRKHNASNFASDETTPAPVAPFQGYPLLPPLQQPDQPPSQALNGRPAQQPTQQPRRQPAQRAPPLQPRDVIDLTGPESAESREPSSSSPSSSCGSSGKKRKRSAEPRGEAKKRARMLADLADSAEQTVPERLAAFERTFDTTMPGDFSASGDKAIERFATEDEAEKFLRQQSADVKHYKLRILPKDDTVHMVEGENLTNVRRSLLAALQKPPMPAPNGYKFREAYDHNHSCQYNDLTSKLVNDQNHLEVAAKLFVLVKKVKDVHRLGLTMPELNASRFDTADKLNSPWLPADAETRICKKVIDQSLTCVDRFFQIAKAIEVNKWVANDFMRGSRDEDWIVLICNPDQCLELKASNWESNYQKKLQKEAGQQAKRASGPEVIALDDDE